MHTQQIDKTEAVRLVDELPDTATWEDLMQKIYVREAIEEGLADSAAGRTDDRLLNDRRGADVWRAVPGSVFAFSVGSLAADQFLRMLVGQQ